MLVRIVVEGLYDKDLNVLRGGRCELRVASSTLDVPKKSSPYLEVGSSMLKGGKLRPIL